MIAPEISVIVLNYNGRRWLGPCLDALAAQQDAPAFEGLVVDNASSDGSAAFVAEAYPDVRVVHAGSNRGFAGGNNLGAAAAHGGTLVFLNNDTVAAPGWLHRLHRAFVERGRGWLVASRIVFLDRPGTIDSAGDGYLRAGGAFKRGHLSPEASCETSMEVFGACGAAFMIGRDVFDALGGFDERWFMVYEDVDLSYRARLAGHRCWYAADAIVRHAGSATLGALSPAAVYYGQRNLEWTWIKNTPWPLLLRQAPAHLAYSAAGVVHYARMGRAWTAVRAKLAALGGLPAILAARAHVQRSRRVATGDLEALMERGWLSLKRREKSARLDLADHDHPRVR